MRALWSTGTRGRDKGGLDRSILIGSVLQAVSVRAGDRERAIGGRASRAVTKNVRILHRGGNLLYGVCTESPVEQSGLSRAREDWGLKYGAHGWSHHPWCPLRHLGCQGVTPSFTKKCLNNIVTHLLRKHYDAYISKYK